MPGGRSPVREFPERERFVRDCNPPIAGEMKPDKLELDRSRERTNRPAMSHLTLTHEQKEEVDDEFQEERSGSGLTNDCLRERRRDACFTGER